MPAKSRAQRIVMAIADSHPDKLYARNKGVALMSHKQLHDFAAVQEDELPEHVKKAKKYKGLRGKK